MTSSAGASGLTLVASPPSSVTASRDPRAPKLSTLLASSLTPVLPGGRVRGGGPARCVRVWADRGVVVIRPVDPRVRDRHRGDPSSTLAPAHDLARRCLAPPHR